MIKTRITTLLGCDYPLISGGMGSGIASPELVAAVLQTGAFSILGSANNTLAEIKTDLARLKDLTDKPFGINLLLIPGAYPDARLEEVIEVIVEAGVRVVETAGRSPREIIPRLKEAGITVLHKAARFKDALSAERAGADAVALLAFDAAAHISPQYVGQLVQIQRASAALTVPYVVAGGVATGRGVLAALAAGADGVLMGTRFFLSAESPLHPETKAALLRADADDTVILAMGTGDDVRVYKSPGAIELSRQEHQENLDYPSLRKRMSENWGASLFEGKHELGAFPCGQAVGLIQQVQSVKEIVAELTRDLRHGYQRLQSLFDPQIEGDAWIAPRADPVSADDVRTVPDLLRQAAARWPSRLFLASSQRQLTYAQTHEEVQRLAHWFSVQGVKPGDRVALWMSNHVEWVLAQLAVSWLGAILVPVNPRLRQADLASVIARSGARFVVTSSEKRHVDYLGVLEAIVEDKAGPAAGARVFAFGSVAGREAFGTAIPQQLPDAEIAAAPVKWDDPAYLLYTSGTTSAPKGVILTYRSLGNAIKARIYLDHGDVVSFEYPLSAITGCHNSVLGALYVGSTLLIHDGSDPQESARLAVQHKATVFAGHRLALIAQAERWPADLPRFYKKAQVFPIDPTDRWAYEALGIQTLYGGYGMTETSGGVVFAWQDIGDALSDKAYGKPAYQAQVKIVLADGKTAGIGQEGEIHVKGPQVMAGYWEDPAATAKVFTGQGWLRTGDLGYISEDGNLVFVERITDSYKTNGFNVSPGEIENIIKRHAGVKDAVVAGVPDPSSGEAKGVAFILSKPGAEIDVTGILASVRQNLASFKTPKDVVLVDEIPRTVTGKPRRKELVAWYLENARERVETR